jgi:hypothetical protein
VRTTMLSMLAIAGFLLPAGTAVAQSQGGGTQYESGSQSQPRQAPSPDSQGGTEVLPPPEPAQLAPDGTAIAPASAPPAVQAIISAGNQIASKPYRYGGGHGRWNDRGYDCSGSVSFALHGAALISRAMDSSQFMRWGDSGPGQWVTIYANGGHAFMVVAGLRFDTSGRTGHGSRWQAAPRSSRGYRVRHPDGL